MIMKNSESIMQKRYLSLLNLVKEKHGIFEHLIDDKIALKYLKAIDAVEITKNWFVKITNNGEHLLDTRHFEEKIKKERREEIKSCIEFVAFVVTFIFGLAGIITNLHGSKNQKLGEYIYIDKYECVHVDQECVNIIGRDDGKSYKYMVERIDTKDLKLNYINNTCSSCITDDIYNDLEKIANTNENKSKIYFALKNFGVKDLGTEEYFKSKLEKENNLKKVYSFFKRYGFTEFGNDFKDFENKINGEELFSSMPDNISKLYNELIDTYDIGSESEFRRNLSNGTKREILRKAIGQEYNVGDSIEFTKYLGF